MNLSKPLENNILEKYLFLNHLILIQNIRINDFYIISITQFEIRLQGDYSLEKLVFYEMQGLKFTYDEESDWYTSYNPISGIDITLTEVKNQISKP
jgi:hypothetical protein